jgi:acyl-CoA synthetase (AMP-forming)/AMP-acid ligase II
MTTEQRRLAANADFDRDNLVARLFRWEHERPDAIAFRYLLRGEEEAERVSWAKLAQRVRALASELSRVTLGGDRALLFFEPGLDFVVAFLSCWVAGVIAVPVAPPKPREGLRRLQAVAESCEPSLLLTSERLVPALLTRAPEAPLLSQLAVFATDAVRAPETRPDAAFLPAPLESTTLAFLQYTSGSTGTPKGVTVTHGNVLANVRMMVAGFGVEPASVVVGWLPLHHDMGLIGNVLVPVYVGCECVLMNPVDFIVRPLRWLKAVSRYRATISGGPNFAFDLCVERLTPPDLTGLDLSSWSVAFCGAEPVRARTLQRFARSFAAVGFDSRAFSACYGMAECTLFASGCERKSGITERWLDASALEVHRALPAEPDAAGARSFVGCGHTWLEQELRIVNPQTRLEVGEGEIGEIWIRGPHVAAGYFRNREQSAKTFSAELAHGDGKVHLRTGDLGFVESGHLFVTGRLTEMIIVRGRNYYAEDLEFTARNADPLLRDTTRSAAFARDVDGQEALVIVQEVRRDELAKLTPDRLLALESRIRAAIGDEHGIQPREVVLVRPSGIPCTTSGKVRRRECRSLHEQGKLPYLTAEAAGHVNLDTVRNRAP